MSERTRATIFQTGLLLVWAALLLLIFCFTSCGTRPKDPTVGTEMRDAYRSVADLYSFVWNPTEFQDPKNEKKILEILDRLAADFHRVDAKAPDSVREPGFESALQVQQHELRDVRRRFKQGSKEYANWRLRNLSENCIACHSRFQAPVDFLGAPPQPVDGGFEEQLAAAQFLFATRQFDKASDALMSLARRVGQLPSGSASAFRALQLWLVIEVRVKNRFAEASRDLGELLGKLKFADYERQSVKSWMKDLETLTRQPATTVEPLTVAQGLLNPVLGAQSIDSDNASLVKSLRASSILHAELQGMPRSEKRRKATFLLALAYTHMPIETFQGFREQYLEQCIREFPDSDEARAAFDRYAELLEAENSGSGGLHLDDEQVAKLKELRELAYGRVPPPKVEKKLRFPGEDPSRPVPSPFG